MREDARISATRMSHFGGSHRFLINIHISGLQWRLFRAKFA
jgi:hypothetical protein